MHHARFHRLQARSNSKNCIEQELKFVVNGNDDVALTHSDNDDDDDDDDDDNNDDDDENNSDALHSSSKSAFKSSSTSRRINTRYEE